MELTRTYKLEQALFLKDADDDHSLEDDPSTSMEYKTVSNVGLNDEIDAGGTEDELTSVTDYETISADMTQEGQHTSMSDYRTLSPDDNDNRDEFLHEITDYECKICIKRFATLQQCLRHELLEHNNARKSPQKNVRLRLKSMMPVLEQGSHQIERPRIHRVLRNCQKGSELQELFNIYCVKDEKVNQLRAMVTSSVLKDLCSLKGLSVYTFGSIVNGLMLWDSDVDIYVTAKIGWKYEFDPVNANENRKCWGHDAKDRMLYNRLNSLLRRGRYFEDIVTIRRARVPIIKCRHPTSGMKIDINCACPNSVVNSHFLEKLLLFDVRLRSLMRFIKIWAKQMKLIGRNMTSYCLTTLILFYLQQSLPGQDPIVPSIQQFQMNVKSNSVQGINYGFDIYRHMKLIPVTMPTTTFIRGFFAFYRHFDFSTKMICPFLGKAILLADFKSGKYRYVEYEQQLASMANFHKEPIKIEELSIGRCMIVQDPFQLNLNISRGVMSPHLEYFRKCIDYAYHICMNPDIRSDGELYERLLFDIITEIEVEARALREIAGRRLDVDQPHQLIFSFSPSRVELRSLANYPLGLTNREPTNIYCAWVRHYVEAIYAILTFIYHIDVTLADVTATESELETETGTETETANTLENNCSVTRHAGSDHTSRVESFIKFFDKHGELVWLMNSSIDLWTGRSYNRQNSQSFMEYQITQTEQLLKERKGVRAFEVPLRAHLKIQPQDENKALLLVVSNDKLSQVCISKKDPLRKFFANFKNSMQNFNLKEKLQAETGRKQIPQAQDFKIWKKCKIETSPHTQLERSADVTTYGNDNHLTSSDQ